MARAQQRRTLFQVPLPADVDDLITVLQDNRASWEGVQVEAVDASSHLVLTATRRRRRRREPDQPDEPEPTTDEPTIPGPDGQPIRTPPARPDPARVGLP